MGRGQRRRHLRVALGVKDDVVDHALARVDVVNAVAEHAQAVDFGQHDLQRQVAVAAVFHGGVDAQGAVADLHGVLIERHAHAVLIDHHGAVLQRYAGFLHGAALQFAGNAVAESIERILVHARQVDHPRVSDHARGLRGVFFRARSAVEAAQKIVERPLDVFHILFRGGAFDGRFRRCERVVQGDFLQRGAAFLEPGFGQGGSKQYGQGQQQADQFFHGKLPPG